MKKIKERTKEDIIRNFNENTELYKYSYKRDSEIISWLAEECSDIDYEDMSIYYDESDDCVGIYLYVNHCQAKAWQLGVGT